MRKNNVLKIATAGLLVFGLSACGKDSKKAPVAKTPAKPAPAAQADPCPQGVESLWFVNEDDGKTTAFAVSKVDGVMRFTLGGYAEQIIVDGKPQKLTPKAKLKEHKIVEVTARCENQVVLMSEKDSDGSVKESEWRLNADEAMGNLTIKSGGQTQILVLRKNLVAETGGF